MISEEQNDQAIDQRDHSHQSQLASVGQIAAGIAHEVRNPLTAVKGFLQLLKEKSPDSYIDVAEMELNHALMTLENLLQVSKPDKEDESLCSFKISAELESILYLFQDQLYRVNLITDFQDVDSAIIYGKKNQLKKAFFNLFKNAFEAIPKQGAITVKQYIEDHNVHIVIQDTGVGIPKEKFPFIGTPFFTTKEDGTGMGLAQVFTVIYQHGGKIEVDSEENKGTTFHLIIPSEMVYKKDGVIHLDIDSSKGITLKEFFLNNRDIFEQQLLLEAVNVKEKIKEIHTIGSINLLENAHKLVLYIIENRRHDLMMFAKKEGEAWAKHSLTIAFKLEWIQAIRRVLWDFLYNFDRIQELEVNRDYFYTLERNINELIDQFLNSFFISYTKAKDDILHSHQQLINELTVPIVRFTSYISFLPLVGKVDKNRIKTIKDKVFGQVLQSEAHSFIIDLSKASFSGEAELLSFLKMIDGISMIGCRTIITGVGQKLVEQMMGNNLSFNNRTETYRTVNQALEQYYMKS